MLGDVLIHVVRLKGIRSPNAISQAKVQVSRHDKRNNGHAENMNVDNDKEKGKKNCHQRSHLELLR
jgi:hypothetical protein